MSAKDILLAVIIPLALAELGPWCGWLAARLLPSAARLRYGDTERAVVRLEEWSSDLNDVPGQLTKLTYAIGQLAAGSAISMRRKAKSALRKTEAQGLSSLTEEALVALDQAGALDRQRELIEALASLPARQREALTLRYYGDMSMPQIAATMGISSQAVRIHTVRGMNTLRARLNRPPDAPHARQDRA